MIESTGTKSEYATIIDQQIESMQRTIDDIQIQLRTAINETGAKKSTSERGVYINGLSHALAQANTSLCALIGARYTEKNLQMDQQVKIVSVGQWLQANGIVAKGKTE